jgi:hypothetical protein
VWLLVLFIPNLIWTEKQLKQYKIVSAKENKVLIAFERAGQICVTSFVLIFNDFDIQKVSLWTIWLAVSFLLSTLYEVC